MATAGAPVGAETLLAPVRLSDWIVATSTASSYAPGVVWRSARERPAQHALVAQLHADIAARTADGEDLAPASAQRLRAWLAARPVTGRVLLVPPMAAHARQLQPHADPVIPAGDDLDLPDRPATVTVLRDDGTRCDLRFRATHRAADYLRRCALTDETGLRAVDAVDQVHVVQPDGLVQRVGVAAWNADAQDAPAPGAWLWAPARASRWPDAASDRMATFLATQGPADAGHHTPLQPTQPSSALTETPTLPRDLPLSASDWGMTGLLQTPTARTRSAGHVGLTVHRAWPYTQSTVVLSPFDRLEIGVRYTSVSHQLYGPEIAGDQSYKDKSSEIRWRLWEENAWRPALAMGLRDPGGTGLFAGEYLVGSKRIGDLDLSLGLGWGYLGARGSMGNPLARLGLRSAQRVQGAVGAGGTAHLSSLFTGRTALFGGLQWHTPWAPLQVKLEWDGNDYRHEPFGHDLQARSPLNLGLHWQNGPLHLNVSVQRGRQWAAGVSFETPLERIGVARTDSRPRTPVAPTAPAAPPAPGTALLDALSQDTGWTATRLQTGSEWVVEFDPAHGVQVQPRIERAIARLHQVAPASVQRFRLVRSSHEQPMAQTVVDRAAWVEARTQWLPPTQRRHPLVTAEAGSGTEPDAPSDRVAQPPTPTRHSVHLGYQQHLGGPDGYLYALTLRASAQARLWPGGWVQGSVSARLSDNYDHFAYTAPSGLPRVRTYLREYLTTARVTVPNLQLTHLHRLGDSVFGLAYAGLLESMFAGAGAEVLWRPLDSRWAVGVDLNRVQPRGFDQRLGLRGAALTTGHLSLHWDTGWHGVQASTAVGQYLAGDRGATLDLSRVFDNGTRIGAWLTRTNVSAAQFGEGSFDKGLYIAIPFDAFVSAWSGQSAVLAWQPLIRDGGARLQRQHTLWGLTQARDRQALRYRSAVADD
jgi:Exopolysaccharide biosynthesis protein YbjH/Capsule biosynthesis GfcC